MLRRGEEKGRQVSWETGKGGQEVIVSSVGEEVVSADVGHLLNIRVDLEIWRLDGSLRRRKCEITITNRN